MRERFADPDSPAKAFSVWSHAQPYGHALFRGYKHFTENAKTTDEIAELCVLDRYFLLVFMLKRVDAMNPWLYKRCREVEAEKDGYLDLWARFHYKSTIITFAGIIQEHLIEPALTVAIFSITRDVAKAFQRQIMFEYENNEELHLYFPEVFWGPNPRAAGAPKWNEDDGIVLRRDSNPKESSLEAWGLIDNMPTSRHYSLRVYDDAVNEKSVTTPDMIQKTTERWELSLNLGEGAHGNREWYIGTRYSFADSYQEMIKRGAAIPRLYPATDNGLPDGKPVFVSQEKWDELVKKTSLKTLACQQLQNPLAGADTALDVAWIRVYEVRPLTLNVYIVVDPARTKRKTSDRTGIMVVGLDHQWNRYLLDGMLHRMSLSERWVAIRRLRTKWRRAPGVQLVEVGYERYGAEADLDYFEEQMEIDKDVFTIKPLVWNRDAPDSYQDRIQRLEPHFRNGRFFFPYQGRETRLQRDHRDQGAKDLIAGPIKQVDENNHIYNLAEILIEEEYKFFPAVHCDGLDALSRTEDMEMIIPVVRATSDLLPPRQAAAR